MRKAADALRTLREGWENWQWIFGYSRRFRKLLILYTCLGLGSSTLGLLASLAGKFLVDVVVGRKIEQLWLAALATAGSALLSLGAGSLTGRVKLKLETDVTNAVRADVLSAVTEANWESLNHFTNGELLNRFHGDIASVAGNAAGWLPRVLVSLYSFAAAFLVIFHYSKVMSLIALSTAPVILLAGRTLLEKQKTHRQQMMEAAGGMYTFETETLYNLDTLKSFGAADLFRARLQDLQARLRSLTLSWNMFQIRTNAFMAVLGMAAEYAAYGYALYLLWSGAVSYGTMTLFLQQRGALTGAFRSVLSAVPGFVTGSVSAGRIRELMSLPREEFSTEKIPESFFAGGLAVGLDRADFAYAGGEAVLRDACFEALPGQATALAGPSGEGKTTVLRLLLGLIRPSAGSCFFRTRDGQTLPAGADTRALIASVPQGNTLLGGTIAENLRLGRQDATEAEMESALRLACAWEFVEKLPEGIHSAVHERGKGLSEGQAQRIAIARALLRGAPVLLLDEATSALDADTEQQVLRGILRRMPDRTVILTTHRPSVLALCDRVYRVAGGRILPVGPGEAEKT